MSIPPGPVHVSSDIMEELNALFDWNPPPLRLASQTEGGSRSKTTRPAAFYDKHLASHLVLEKVKHVKHLHKKIARVVDNKLKSIEERGITLPPPTKGFLTAETHQDHQRRENKLMRNESSVAEFYRLVTVHYCVYVASTLSLHPRVWDSALIWSLVPQNHGHAISDGSLQVNPPENTSKRGWDDEEQDVMWDFVDEDKLTPLLEIKDRYRDLATWEIKSLSVGNKDAMFTLLATAAVNDGKFYWTFCNGDPCVSKKGHVTQKPLTGWDAPETLSLVTTPWIDSDLAEEDQSRTSLTDILDDSLKRGGSSLEIVNEFDRRLKDDAKGSRRGKPSPKANPSPKPSPSSLGSPKSRDGLRSATKASSPIGLWQARNADVESSMGGSVVPSQLTPPTNMSVANGPGPLTAKKLLQQAWAQGVRSNATFLILHSGNFEFITVRHRSSQTLYISDLLHVPRLARPGYGKVQIGIYIEALDDAFLRNELDKVNPEGDLPLSVDPVFAGKADQRGSDSKNGDDRGPEPPKKKSKGGGSSGGHKPRGGRQARPTSAPDSKDGDDGPEPDAEWVIQQSQSLSRYVLLLHIKYDIYDSVRPAIFYRGARVNSNNDGVLTPPTTPATTFPKDVRLLLFLTSQLGQGATGITHGGILEIEMGNKSSTLEIAAKLAFTDDEQEGLVSESSIYDHMVKEGVKGIPTFLGVFHDIEVEGPSCLLMSQSGISLQDRGTSISSAECVAFLSALESIHAAGVLHGDLRLENLLVNDSGDISIIDFDQARQGAPEDDLREEYALFYDMLHAIIDENEEEQKSSVEPEVAVVTNVKEKGKGRAKRAIEDEPTKGGSTAPAYKLRPRNEAGKVVAVKRT